MSDLADKLRALLADGPDTWTPYDSRDTGETFLAECVLDFTRELRTILDAESADTCTPASVPSAAHDGAVGGARKGEATMPDRILTDDDCARIVAASIDPDRVLGGIDGYHGGPADVLLTTVEGIVAEHTRAIREAVER